MRKFLYRLHGIYIVRHFQLLLLITINESIQWEYFARRISQNIHLIIKKAWHAFVAHACKLHNFLQCPKVTSSPQKNTMRVEIVNANALAKPSYPVDNISATCSYISLPFVIRSILSFTVIDVYIFLYFYMDHEKGKSSPLYNSHVL